MAKRVVQTFFSLILFNICFNLTSFLWGQIRLEKYKKSKQPKFFQKCIWKIKLGGKYQIQGLLFIFKKCIFLKVKKKRSFNTWNFVVQCYFSNANYLFVMGWVALKLYCSIWKWFSLLKLVHFTEGWRNWNKISWDEYSTGDQTIILGL